MPAPAVTLLAGVPTSNPWLYRRVPFPVGDPVVFVEFGAGASAETVLILRDIEMDRAKAARIATHVHSPTEFTPSGGLSGDRETATAQATAEMLVRRGVSEVRTDRSLPMIFAHFLALRGVAVRCEPDLGVLERRSKSPREIEALRAAQKIAEQCVRWTCERIASAQAGAGGALMLEAEPLTSERVRSELNIWLLREGAEPCSDAIIACGAQGGDCHERGSGQLFTAQPIIVDIWPRDPRSRYFGDCTRTVVHGPIDRADPLLVEMHGAVAHAKREAIAATRAGATGEAVHAATTAAFRARGFAMGLPPHGATGKASATCAHGTGHGVGLDVHEPPLLAEAGPPLIAGDCVTIEPGLYSHAVGGVRIEDMLIVRAPGPGPGDGAENLNSIPEGLTWA